MNFFKKPEERVGEKITIIHSDVHQPIPDYEIGEGGVFEKFKNWANNYLNETDERGDAQQDDTSEELIVI